MTCLVVRSRAPPNEHNFKLVNPKCKFQNFKMVGLMARACKHAKRVLCTPRAIKPGNRSSTPVNGCSLSMNLHSHSGPITHLRSPWYTHSLMNDSSYALVTTGTWHCIAAAPPNRFSRIFWYGTLLRIVSRFATSSGWSCDLESRIDWQMPLHISSNEVGSACSCTHRDFLRDVSPRLRLVRCRLREFHADGTCICIGFPRAASYDADGLQFISRKIF